MSDHSEIQFLKQQLRSNASTKRRSAAKKLRMFEASTVGPELIEALTQELKNPRAWETQYQMIMAIGDSGYCSGLKFLTQLSMQHFEATMIETAIGDAITKLEHRVYQQPQSLARWLQDNDNSHFVEGSIRAIATLRLLPSDALISSMIKYVQVPENRYIEFWVAAASPEWPKNLTRKFLDECIALSKLDDTKKAARAALDGQYLKWKSL